MKSTFPKYATILTETSLLALKKQKKKMQAVPIFEADTDTLAWQLSHFDFEWHIIYPDNPEIKKYEHLPKPKGFDPKYDKLAVLISPYDRKAVEERIMEEIYDKDWTEENNKRSKKEWAEHFGEDIPYGEPQDIYILHPDNMPCISSP